MSEQHDKEAGELFFEVMRISRHGPDDDCIALIAARLAERDTMLADRDREIREIYNRQIELEEMNAGLRFNIATLKTTMQIKDSALAAAEERAQAQFIELMERIQEIVPPGGEISRAEILAMIDDRIKFPRIAAEQGKE